MILDSVMKIDFKNDAERIEFLENYRNMDLGWCLWKDDRDRQLRVFRNDITENLCFLVEEQLLTFSWPNRNQKWTVRDRYIVNWAETGDRMERGMQTFGDQRASRTQQLTALKELQKRKKQ